jgi:AcrR family transcriptional regulator
MVLVPRSDVNGSRTYDASGRRRRARERRERVLDAASGLLAQRGFAGTTVAAVAEASRVSPETVYKAFGGKAGIVRALWDRGLRGAGSIPAEERSDFASSHLDDPRAVIARWTEIGTEVAPRAAPLLLLLREAGAVDADARRLHRELLAQNLTRMEHNARAIERHLRPGLTVERARDVLVAYTTPELYELLVLRQGWSLRDYAEFQRRGIEASLLTPGSEGDRGAGGQRTVGV